MMKKIWKLFGLTAALALLFMFPFPLVTNDNLAALKTFATSEPEYTIPNQGNYAFTDSPIQTTPITNWGRNTSFDYLTHQQVNINNNDDFRNKHSDNLANLLTDKQLNNRSPLVMTNDADMPTRGSYTSGSISLPANGYYAISVDYYVNCNIATFYLNQEAISLAHNNGWLTSTFYVKTDRLVSSTVEASVFFGSKNADTKGAVYFDNFSVKALSKGAFCDAAFQDGYTDESDTPLLKSPSDEMFLDFTCTDDIQDYKTNLTRADFTADHSSNSADATNNIAANSVLNKLKIKDAVFFTHDGDTSVMLMHANAGQTSLTIEDWKFTPKPHEVYMFQFYSIMDTNLANFYLQIGDTQEKIAAVENYPYHNAWQLNTVFYVAGYQAQQEHEIAFTLGGGDEGDVTGWVALNDLRIYKVSGTYAKENEKALGVHDFNDMNNTGATLDVANGNFDLGTASDLSDNYPYPLVADSWSTDSLLNGIVNQQFWPFDWAKPEQINNYYLNNNIYMLRNTTRTTNKVTSPTLNTNAGTSKYLSFDAIGKPNAEAVAQIVTTDNVVLGKIKIDDNRWQHYEFELVENEASGSHSFNLVFAMEGVGEVYFDNLRMSETAYDFATAESTVSVAVNFMTPVDNVALWQVDDNSQADVSRYAVNDGIVFEKVALREITIKHTLPYTLTSGEYYHITVTARGENTAIGLSGFDGNLIVVKDENDLNAKDTYHLYLKATSDTTSVNFLITLKEGDAAEIYLSSIVVANITEDEFALADDSNNRNNLILTAATIEEDDDIDDNGNGSNPNNFFGENWWYLIPTLITAIAIVLAVACFLFRKIRFEKHITRKTTSYARDVKLKSRDKKIVAEKSAKVDNVTDETPNN